MLSRFFLEFLLLAIRFCLSSVYTCSTSFQCRATIFSKRFPFSPNCPSSFFISSERKHESLLSELFQIWWNLVVLRSFILCFPIPCLSFTGFISVGLCSQAKLSMQKLVENFIAGNELIWGSFKLLLDSWIYKIIKKCHWPSQVNDKKLQLT